MKSSRSCCDLKESVRRRFFAPQYAFGIFDDSYFNGWVRGGIFALYDPAYSFQRILLVYYDRCITLSIIRGASLLYRGEVAESELFQSVVRVARGDRLCTCYICIFQPSED